MPDQLKCLSLWQPHALAIVLGLKHYETRDWPIRHRGQLGIHAAKREWKDSDPWSIEAARRLVHRIYPSIPEMNYASAMRCLLHPYLAYGALVCIVDVVDCQPTSALRGNIPPDHEFWGDFTDGEFGKGRYAARLVNVRVFRHPIPTRGCQGFFNVPLTPSAGQLALFNSSVPDTPSTANSASNAISPEVLP